MSIMNRQGPEVPLVGDRVLVVELRDSDAWGFAARAVVTVPSKDHGKLSNERRLADPTPFDDNGSDYKAGFRHPASQAQLCFLCLATCVAYVMKQDTLGSTPSQVHFSPLPGDLAPSSCSSWPLALDR